MKKTITLFLTAFLAISPLTVKPILAAPANVPDKYEKLYDTLNKSLSDNEKLLTSTDVVWGGAGVELVGANSNKGADLLKPETLKFLYKNIDILSKMGATGLTINIAFPLLRPSTPKQKEYIAFYKKLATYIKSKKMTIMVKVHNIFPDPVYGNPGMKIKGMKYEDYLKQKKDQILLVAKEIKPDFLTLDNEPGTQKFITGFNFTPDLWKNTISYFLKDFKHDGIKVGAGAGSWDDINYFKGLCELPLDFIDVHIYPITNDFFYKSMDKIGEVVRISGKSLVIGEAWLYKTDVYNQSDFQQNYIQTFLRDSYSFWEPLDTRFIKAVWAVAKLEHSVYTSFFWSNYFFSYIDYKDEYETADPKVVLKLEAKAATTNMFSNPPVTTNTGKAFVEIMKSASSASVKIIYGEDGGRVSYCKANGLIALDRPGEDGYFDVWTMKPDGTELKNLTHGFKDISKHNGNPCWHPSGKYIVFQAQDPNYKMKNEALATPGIGINNNIYIISADGKNIWRESKVRNGGGSLHPQFSPDGSRLLWSNAIPSTNPVGSWEMLEFEMSFNGAPKLVSMNTLNPGNLQLYETHGYSPDGKSIIFSGIPSGKGYFDMDIYTCDSDGGNLKKLNTNNEWDEHAHFSPDGKKIVWASSDGTKCPKETAKLQLDYWVMNADGTGKKRITFLNDSTNPQYLGKVIASDFDWIDGNTIVSKIGAVQNGKKIELVAVIKVKI